MIVVTLHLITKEVIVGECDWNPESKDDFLRISRPMRLIIIDSGPHAESFALVPYNPLSDTKVAIFSHNDIITVMPMTKRYIMNYATSAQKYELQTIEDNYIYSSDKSEESLRELQNNIHNINSYYYENYNIDYESSEDEEYKPTLH